MWLATLLACQDPFPEDRHDLTDFRIAAMERHDGEDRTLLWSEHGLWHEVAPTVVAMSYGDSGFSVSATDASGHTETGELVLEDGAVNPTVSSVSTTEADGVWTIDLTVDDDATTHFMAPAGEFTETGPHTTEWDPGDATGVVPIVTLSYDGLGGVTWLVVDVPVDVDPPYLQVGTRIFPVDPTGLTSGTVLATLAADDGYAGVTLTDLTNGAVADGDGGCGSVGGAVFDFDHLAEGLCARDDVVGLRVAVDAQVTP